MRDAGNAGAIGHAQRLQPVNPGSNPTAGRRGRRPLRAVAKRKNQHHGKQMRHRRKLPPTPLGSPERGAVTAQRAVTEGLVQGGCGETTSSAASAPTPTVGAGFHARPAWVKG